MQQKNATTPKDRNIKDTVVTVKVVGVDRKKVVKPWQLDPHISMKIATLQQNMKNYCP